MTHWQHKDASQQQGNESGLSRRAFLKGGTIFLGGVAVEALSILSLTSCSRAQFEEALSDASGLGQSPRTITDDAGRELTLPAVADLDRVCCTSALAQFFLVTTAWEKLGGLTSSLSADEAAYLPEGLQSLISLGSLTSNTLNLEALMLEDIQIIFSISAVPLTAGNISDANDIQEQTGIPVVLIDGSMDRIADAYRLLGECLGTQERASTLADYCVDAYNKVTDAVADIPDNEKATIYYAEGPAGLNTEPRGNQHSIAFEVAGVRNVCDWEDSEDIGMADVSLEDIYAWNPEYIFAWSFERRGGADYLISVSSDWSAVDAVRNHRVYTMPDTPFAWIDRPSAANRFLGIQWICNLIYPDRYNVDMCAVVQEFYGLFYQKDITQQQAQDLLDSARAYGG